MFYYSHCKVQIRIKPSANMTCYYRPTTRLENQFKSLALREDD